MIIWVVSMECAGISEAGGVKNVTFSLCKELKQLKQKVCLFIPIYKCTDWNNVTILDKDFLTINVNHCKKNEVVSFTKALSLEGNFEIIFINHPSFSQKEGVYTYTANEQRENPEHQKGTGHVDTLFKDSLFTKAIFEYGKSISSAHIPDIVHCQDASTALLPAFLKKDSKYDKTKSVVTIHNAGPAYHHEFKDIDEALWYTDFTRNELCVALNSQFVEPFLLAVNSGACLTTVSENYAKELRDPENYETTQGLSKIFYEKNIPVIGITNGIDYGRYNPTDITISKLPFAFNPEKNDLDGKLKARELFLQKLTNDVLLDQIKDIKKYGFIDSSEKDNSRDLIYIAYHGRITSQKGLSVLVEAIPAILQNYNDVRFIINGQGEVGIEASLIELSSHYAGHIVFLNGYNQEIARLTTASCDFIVLPSFFEPCGLEDFIAQIYGTVPVAHKTGGLCKIQNEKTGFLYDNNTEKALIAKLSEIIAIKKYSSEIINKIIKQGAVHVHKNNSWEKIVKEKYMPLFKQLIKLGSV
ncbi:MAG: glycogen/starch synthase [Treponema sp.]|nr:glycogen/starch synthase [Treponema sp.]